MLIRQKKAQINFITWRGWKWTIIISYWSFFQKLGYECIAPDLPGFGLTKIHKPNS
tara:strand:+ start:272 stop:439 length:168 start_codon:yes stop_codon:yes gene_type:complete